MDKKLIIFGTRPEFIKLLPVFLEIKEQGLEKGFISIFTGQHMDLVKDLFIHSDFEPDFIIPEKNHQNSLGSSFSHIFSAIQEVIEEIERSDKITMIIAQGDTTSCVCAAISSFLHEIPLVHIEAGLRTHDFKNPFPEEYFRRIVSLSSTIHFAPTIEARDNLLHEGVCAKNIIVTGNTIVDTIEFIKSRGTEGEVTFGHLNLPANAKVILITCHRRENQNSRFQRLIDTVKILAGENPSCIFVWVSHMSPFVQTELSKDVFEDHENIVVVPPMNLPEMYSLFTQTRVIITDSGGIQEEAPSFNIPVIVVREVTERNESVKLGYSILSDNSEGDLVPLFNRILASPPVKMINPFGDGKAARRIVDYLKVFDPGTL